MKQFDLLVIGSGPAGGQVASDCAAEGWNVAIAESREFGGTCALRGCNPKKVLVHAAEVVDAARRSDGKLCDAGDIGINWGDLIRFKDSFVKDVPKGSRTKFEDKGITTFLGSPRFVSQTQLEIGGELIEPKHILIATGSRPRPLDIEGETLVTTSDEFMNLDRLPARTVFIGGGGYISFEFAHVAVRAGAAVTIIERGDRPLKSFEESIIGRLVAKSIELGIDVRTESSVKSIEKSSDGSLQVAFESNGETQIVEADVVVHGAGRTPNLDDLDLLQGGVDFDEQKGVLVDEQLRSTSNRIVMAAGDCAATGATPLTPTASTEGFTAAHNLLESSTKKVTYGAVPAAVFTVPAVASIGLTELAATEQGRTFTIKEGDMSDWGAVKKVCQSAAAFKVLIDDDSDRIIGAHLIGPAAADIINLFAIAMKAGLTTSELKSTLLAFPTSTYNLRQMI